MNIKITDYKTAVGSDVPELDKEVNKLIKAGFEPYGSPYPITTETAAMVDCWGRNATPKKLSAEDYIIPRTLARAPWCGWHTPCYFTPVS
jgi:hypothetical protein